LLEAWQAARAEVDAIKKPAPNDDDGKPGILQHERELREAVATYLFPHPREGANEVPIAGDCVLRLTHSLVRNVDWPAMLAARGALAELGISLDGLIDMKPTLRVSVYRALPESAKQIVDRALVITLGASQLSYGEKGTK
jgi:hypothetical protein